MRSKTLWIFNGGLAFEGNPKYLFLYVNKFHPQIKAVWFCYTKECKAFVKKLGFSAVLFSEKKAKKIGKKAGVYVVDQEKEVFQTYLLEDGGIEVLNLWHGVGCKEVGYNINDGFLSRGIAVKRIKNLEIYQNKELFLVTSPLMERHFKKQLRLSERQIIRAGYPRNAYFQKTGQKVFTYDHDILSQKGLSKKTKIALYAPTYRDYDERGFFDRAVPCMERLAKTLEEQNFLLIFKLHPKMTRDCGYLFAKEKYAKNQRILFWDNALDFYEIMDQIHLAIVDYSSIFYDLVAAGVKNFVRYIFDYGVPGLLRDFALDYMDNTCGLVCKDFESLLLAFSKKTLCEERELQKISGRFWAYSENCDTFETLVNSMMLFNSKINRPLKNFFSFDVFDTLIGRTVVDPKAVFLLVQERIQKQSLQFPGQFYSNYIAIRSDCEGNCREYLDKSRLCRNSDKTEISFSMIFERMADVYGLSEKQISLLKKLELECELECSVPIKENIAKLKSLVRAGEKVVLISDMYLPKFFVQKLLLKADSIFERTPLFLSSDSGFQKTKETLFLHVFHQVQYKYGKWIHFGDNKKADFDVPKTLGILPQKIEAPKMCKEGRDIANSIRTYDSHQIASMLSRFKMLEHSKIEDVAYSLFSMYFVPYANWVLRRAAAEKIECLYFISRDGYLLKLACDSILKIKKFDIKTKYIFGSRKTWRLASQLEKIDEEIFSEFGEFAEVYKYEDLVKAAHICEDELLEIIPEISSLKKMEAIPKKEINEVKERLKRSKKYCELLLEKAKKERPLVLRYLMQEIDFSQKFAFVEYWGRGYMQSCLTRLLRKACPAITETECFYCRSIYPSQQGNIRRNFTTNRISMVFIESFFDNIPYESISQYKIEGEKIVPQIVAQSYDKELFEAFNSMVPRFAEDFARLKFEDESQIEKQLFAYAMNAYKVQKRKNATVSQVMSGLRHSGGVFASATVYAPPITLRSIFRHFTGRRFSTIDMDVSLAGSNPIIRVLYKAYKKTKSFALRGGKK